MDLPPRSVLFFKEKDKFWNKQRQKVRQPKERRKRAKKKIAKEREGMELVLKDSAKNKTYLTGGCLTGDEIIAQKNKRAAVKVCRLPNCTNEKPHVTNKSKTCRWYELFGNLSETFSAKLSGLGDQTRHLLTTFLA